MHIEVRPNELVFENVQLHHAYTARVELVNPHDAAVDLTIKPSAAQRYQVRPEKVHLPAGGTVTVVVRLKVMHFPNRKKAKEGQRDYFHMKSRYFEQKFFTTFVVAGTPVKAVHPSTKHIISHDATNTAGRDVPSRATHAQQASRTHQQQSRPRGQEGKEDPVESEVPSSENQMSDENAMGARSRKLKPHNGSEHLGTTGVETGHIQAMENEIRRLTRALDRNEQNLEMEKEKAEDRSQRVLEILKEKDAQIAALKNENVSLQNELDHQQEAFQRFKMHESHGNTVTELTQQLELCRKEKLEVEEELDVIRSSLMELRGARDPGGSGESTQELNAKVKDLEDQLEVMISEVARLRAENESRGGSAMVFGGTDPRVETLQSALNIEIAKSEALSKDLNDMQNKRFEIDTNRSQLELAKKETRKLKQELEEKQRAIDERDDKIEELSTWRESLQNEVDAKKGSENIIANLRHRVSELENLQQTATQTVIDSEHRLSLAIEQVEALRKTQVETKKQSTEDSLSVAALQTAKETIDKLQAKLNLSEGNERVLKKKISEIMEEEIKMAHMEQKKTGGKNPLQYRHQVRSLVMRLDKFRNPEEDKTKSELHAIDLLQKELDEKAMEIIDLRQEMIRQGMEARKRLRAAEENLIERNATVIEYENKLRTHRNDKEIEVRELERTVRILRGNSSLHHQVAGLSAEATAMKKTNARLESESKSLVDQINDANERSRASRAEVDKLRKELSRLKLGIAGTNINKVTPEQIIISLCLKRGEDRLTISRLQSNLDGVGSYKRVLPAGTKDSGPIVDAVRKHTEDVRALMGGSLTAEGQIGFLELQANRLSEQVASLSSELSIREKEFHEAQCEIIDTKEKHADELRRRDEAHSKQIASTSRRLATYITENGTLRFDLRKAERETREVRAKLLNITSSSAGAVPGERLPNVKEQKSNDGVLLADSRREIQRLKSILKDRNTQMSVLMETVDVLQSEMDKDDDIAETLAGQDRLQDRVIELTAQVSEKASTVSKLEQKIEDLKDQLSTALSNGKESQVERNALLSTISVLEASVATERSDADKTRKELDECTRQNNSLVLDLRDLKEQNKDIKRECESWETQLRRARERYLQQLRDHLSRGDEEHAEERSSGQHKFDSSIEISQTLENWKKLDQSLRSLTDSIGTEMKENGGLSWVVERMKQIILENDTTVMNAVKDARKSRWEAENFRRKIILLESSLERYISQSNASPEEQMFLLRQSHNSREAMLRGHIDLLTSIHARKMDELRNHLHNANARVMELEVVARHSQLDCQTTEARLQEALAQQEIVSDSPSESQLLRHLQSIKHATRVIQNLVDDSKGDHGSMLIRLADGMVSDARMDEGHAQQSQHERLQRALEEAKIEIHSLSEWKTAAMEREERLRQDFEEGVEHRGLQAEKRVSLERSKFAKQLANESVKLKEKLASTQMEHARAIEELKLELANERKQQDGSGPLSRARKQRETVDTENLNLLTKVKVLSSELKTLEAQQEGKENAVNELRELVTKIANDAGITGLSKKNGKEVNTAEALAKELVNSKVLISELKRKIRVANRTESELRNSLATRDMRISELKSGKGFTNEDTQQVIAELTRVLTDERARVAILQRQLAVVDEIESEDKDIRVLYNKLERSAQREEKMRKEIMRLSAGMSVEDMQSKDTAIGTAADTVKFGVDYNPEKVQDLQARITELEQKGTKGEGVLEKRLEFLEKALETSESQRRKLAARLSDKESMKKSSVSQPKKPSSETKPNILVPRRKKDEKKGGNGDELGASVTAEQSSVQEAMVADLRVLRRKYDRALETIDALQENLKTRELSITSLKKRIAEDSENFDSREKSLQAALHESEARFKNNRDRLKQEMSDIKAARSELEKRQVRVDAQLQNERASGAQNVHKIEAELRADLSKSKAQIQHLQASAIELKTQLTSMSRTNSELLSRIKERDAQYNRELIRLRSAQADLKKNSMDAETSFHEDMSGASAQAKEIEAQNVKLRQQLLEMANTNQDLLRRLKSFQRDATDDEREEMVKGLQKQVHAMQSTLNEALERSRNAEKEAREVKLMTIEKAKVSLESITGKAHQMEQSMETLDQEKEYLTSRISSLEEERDKLKAKIAELESTNQASNARIAELQHENELRADVLAKKISESMTEEEHSRVRELELIRKEEISNKQKEISSLTDRLRNCESDLKRIAGNAAYDKKTMEETIHGLNSRVESAHKELEELRLAKDAAVSESNRELRRVESQTRKEQDELRKELNTAESHSRHLESSLEKIKHKEKVAQEELKALRHDSKIHKKREGQMKEKLREEYADSLAAEQHEVLQLKKSLKASQDIVEKLEHTLNFERSDVADKMKIMYNEGTRRQEANDSLVDMFKVQIEEMKNAMQTSGKDADLITKLSERTAAVEVLRAQLHEIKGTIESEQRSTRKSSRFDDTKNVMDITDLSVLELKCSRLDVEKRNEEMENQFLKSKLDALEAEHADALKRLAAFDKSEEKSKARVKAVARAANKKVREMKGEAARLRDQIDVMRKNWMPPGEVQEKADFIQTLQNAIKHLKLDLQKKIAASQKFDAEKKEETSKWKDMEDQVKKAEHKAKRAISEATRKAAVEQSLRKKLDNDVSEVKELRTQVENLERKNKELRKALEARRLAMDSMREGVNAQKERLASIQEKMKDSEELHENYRSAKALAHRKSNDANRALKRASEAEATCHEAMDKIAELKKSLHSSEDHAKQISESTTRKLSLVEGKLSVMISHTSASVTAIAKDLIEGNKKLRTRVGALKGALISPEKPVVTHNIQQLSSVANMLDMSMKEVQDLLGSTKKRDADPLSPHHRVNEHRLGSPVRALHEQLLAKLEGAFNEESGVDGSVIKAVLMQLINEKLALEKYLVEVQQSLKNRRDRENEAKMKGAEVVPFPRLEEADDAQGHPPLYTGQESSSDQDHEVLSAAHGRTVVHISRKGSVNIVTDPQTNTHTTEPVDATLSAERASPTFLNTAPLRPQKRAALERRLQQLQDVAGIDAPVASRGTVRLSSRSVDRAVDISLLSPSPYKKKDSE